MERRIIMAMNYNPEIADAIRNFLDEADWHYSFDEENGIFRFGIRLPGKMKHVQYAVVIYERDYNVYAISPLAADLDDPEQMRQMAEFICRANYGLRDGNFEMDFNDGELRYKCYMNCNGAFPTKNMVSASVYRPFTMFKSYNKGILQILFAGMSAADAIELCEGSKSSPVSDSGDEAISVSVTGLPSKSTSVSDSGDEAISVSVTGLPSKSTSVSDSGDEEETSSRLMGILRRLQSGHGKL